MATQSSYPVQQFLERPGEALSSPLNHAIPPIRAIAIILAHGVVRLHRRQKDLDTRTEQRVHDCVLVTKGETQ